MVATYRPPDEFRRDEGYLCPGLIFVAESFSPP
jgi:hypothetical protein